MHFYHPEFLYGLLTLLIPVIIHLFNFKRFKKVYFTNIAFLRNIQQQSKRHSQWRQLVIMFLRMFAVAALVFAFSMPYLSDDDVQKKRSDHHRVNVYVDNSFSMEARAEQGSLLDLARTLAREIALSYSISDQFRLITNDSYLYSENYVNRDVFLEQLENVQIDKQSVAFSQILKKISSGQRIENEADLVYLISDFQTKQADINSWSSDSTMSVFLCPLVAASQGNTFVDSVWVESPVLQPDQTLELFFRIQNQSDQLLGDVPVKLLINGQQKAVLSVDVSAFDQSIMAFKFRLDSAGFYAASIQVEDYPVVYDDQFYFALHLQQSIDVLVVSSEYANLDVLTYLQSDTMFSVEGIKESSIDYSTFSNYQTIVLNALTDFSSGLLIELEKYVKAGGNILFFPKSNQDLEVLNRFCQAMDMSLISNLDTSLVKISEIDLESAEFNGIFDIENQRNKLSDNANLPYFKQTYLPLKKEVNSVSLIQNEAGMTVLLRHQLENGKVYFMLSPVEATQSNFTTHAVFVPVVFNLILQNGFPASLYSNLGRESEVKVSFNSDAMDAKIEMQNMIDTASFIPQYRIQHANIYLSFQQQPSTAGVFQVKNQNQEIARLGFNFDRKESYLNYINYKELNGIVADRQLESVKVFETYNKSISQQIEQVQQGFQLWKLFVLLALLLLIIELFLLRFSKY